MCIVFQNKNGTLVQMVQYHSGGIPNCSKSGMALSVVHCFKDFDLKINVFREIVSLALLSNEILISWTVLEEMSWARDNLFIMGG